MQGTSKRLVKAFCVGKPGTGKTGSIAALVNSGLINRVGIWDFDQNLTVLQQYVDQDKHHLIHNVPLEDNTRLNTDGFIEAIGRPTAHTKAISLGKNWKYTNGDTGEEVELGHLKTWGENDLVVLDSATKHGRAILLYVMYVKNRNGMARRIQDWGAAAEIQMHFFDVLAGSDVGCNVLVNIHQKLVGPPSVGEGVGMKEDNDIKDAKHEHNISKAQHIPWDWYPSAIGRSLPQTVSECMPFVLHYRKDIIGNRTRRVIDPFSTEIGACKLPVKGISKALPQETGLVDIFKAVRGS